MTTPQAPVTRIDLEAIDESGHMVRISQWLEGWQEGDAPQSSELVSGRSIMFILMDYEKQGYTCEMASRTLGRALRGKITRIDFVKLGSEYHIRKYPYGWTAKTKPLTDKIVSESEFTNAVAWCESAHGWTVRNWPSGARAWKGEPKPVRDRASILAVRANAERELHMGETGTNKIFYDFAFDY